MMEGLIGAATRRSVTFIFDKCRGREMPARNGRAICRSSQRAACKGLQFFGQNSLFPAAGWLKWDGREPLQFNALLSFCVAYLGASD